MNANQQREPLRSKMLKPSDLKQYADSMKVLLNTIQLNPVFLDYTKIYEGTVQLDISNSVLEHAINCPIEDYYDNLECRMAQSLPLHYKKLQSMTIEKYMLNTKGTNSNEDNELIKYSEYCNQFKSFEQSELLNACTSLQSSIGVPTNLSLKWKSYLEDLTTGEMDLASWTKLITTPDQRKMYFSLNKYFDYVLQVQEQDETCGVKIPLIERNVQLLKEKHDMDLSDVLETIKSKLIQIKQDRDDFQHKFVECMESSTANKDISSIIELMNGPHYDINEADTEVNLHAKKIQEKVTEVIYKMIEEKYPNLVSSPSAGFSEISLLSQSVNEFSVFPQLDAKSIVTQVTIPIQYLIKQMNFHLDSLDKFDINFKFLSRADTAVNYLKRYGKLMKIYSQISISFLHNTINPFDYSIQPSSLPQALNDIVQEVKNLSMKHVEPLFVKMISEINSVLEFESSTNEKSIMSREFSLEVRKSIRTMLDEILVVSMQKNSNAQMALLLLNIAKAASKNMKIIFSSVGASQRSDKVKIDSESLTRFNSLVQKFDEIISLIIHDCEDYKIWFARNKQANDIVKDTRMLEMCSDHFQSEKSAELISDLRKLATSLSFMSANALAIVYYPLRDIKKEIEDEAQDQKPIHASLNRILNDDEEKDKNILLVSLKDFMFEENNPVAFMAPTPVNDPPIKEEDATKKYRLVNHMMALQVLL